MQGLVLVKQYPTSIVLVVVVVVLVFCPSCCFLIIRIILGVPAHPQILATSRDANFQTRYHEESVPVGTL
jgi:hypothetical protein